MNNNKEFHMFPRLPPEIRLLIWDLALWTPTIVQICVEEDKETGAFRLKNRVVPPLVQTCSESRARALKVYRKAPYECENPEAEVYTNLVIDTIYIGSVTKDIDCVDLVSFISRKNLDRYNLTRLAVDVDYWAQELGRMMFATCLFPFLREITMVLESDSSNGDGEARLVDPDEEDRRRLVMFRKVSGTVYVPAEEFLKAAEAENGYRRAEFLPPWTTPDLKLRKLEGKVFGKDIRAKCQESTGDTKRNQLEAQKKE